MPSTLHKLEMAHSAANDAVRGVAMQHYRVTSELPEDERFFAGAGFRMEVDLHLLLILLVRLQRAAELIARLVDDDDLRCAIDDFDTHLPLKRMRNVGEHVDDYIAEEGRAQPPISTASLGTRWWGKTSKEGMTFSWAGMTIGLDEAKSAAEDLYRALRLAMKAFISSNRPQVPRQAKP